MNADACDAYIAVVFYSVDCFNDLIQFYYVIAEFFMNSSYIDRKINECGTFSVLIFDVSTCGVRKASCGTNVGRGCKRAMQMKSSASGMPQPQLFSISERVA